MQGNYPSQCKVDLIPDIYYIHFIYYGNNFFWLILWHQRPVSFRLRIFITGVFIHSLHSSIFREKKLQREQQRYTTRMIPSERVFYFSFYLQYIYTLPSSHTNSESPLRVYTVFQSWNVARYSLGGKFCCCRCHSMSNADFFSCSSRLFLFCTSLSRCESERCAINSHQKVSKSIIKTNKLIYKCSRVYF